MRALIGLVAAMAVIAGRPALTQTPPPIDRLDDDAFWALVTDLSEAGGAFPAQLMSNEDSAQFVIPALATRVARGGIYIGVGSEQNFTYLAALRPRLAFVVDIRRDNTLEMLLYKALFEPSSDRADFVSRLFARPRPPGLDRDTPVTALFRAYETVSVDSQLAADVARDVRDRLTRTHAFPLRDADLQCIGAMLAAFQAAGPHTLKGFGDRTNPTFAELMAATDLAGRHHGFLASEEGFEVVRDLQRRNLVVPVTGDFAGDKALRGIARYLAGQQAAVDVFYVSNVERYLFERADRGAPFYANVAALPRAQGSVFVRSLTRDISQRLGITLPSQAYKWWTFLFPIDEDLAAIGDGRINDYRDLFAPTR